MNTKSHIKIWPVHGWIGLGLIVVYWYVNWAFSGLRTHLAFFPMWLGYCLVVDALVFRRKGSSMLTRRPMAYIKVFIISAPAWWLFELINLRTQNWFYAGREFFTDFQYAVLATLSFSTVMPAVFGTAELVSTFNWLRRIKPWLKIAPTRATMLGFFVAGWVMLALLILWPLYFFPFVWGSVFCILEPVNVWLRHRSLFQDTNNRDWRPVLSLAVGCLICGFFWEFWNFYAYPKWVYHVPFVGFLKVFEMPILGYLGYIPFSLELFALYHLVTALLKQEERQNFIQISV
jgi:hypothetical protein